MGWKSPFALFIERVGYWCERGELNPYGLPQDPKSCASASSATLAKINFSLFVDFLSNMQEFNS